MDETRIEDTARLAERTSLGVGGPARARLKIADASSASRAVEFAAQNSLPSFVLGGGTNLLVSDSGFEGVLLVPTSREVHCDANTGRCRAAAGATWDELVRASVAAGLGGLECTIGIPGTVGAAPVQNIGAYGQELSQVLVGVTCVDLRDGSRQHFDRSSCHFAYRASRFKGADRGRYLITSVELQLGVDIPPCLDYAQLREGIEDPQAQSLVDVAERVLSLRRTKGMLLEGGPSDLKSAGSFFTNPVLDADNVRSLRDRLEDLGTDPRALPCWDMGASQTKCSAAWLIEASGMHKGYGDGRVGLSDHHVLALVNRGGASAAEIVDFARRVRDRVQEACGVRLVPEPVPLGFAEDLVADLWGPAD